MLRHAMKYSQGLILTMAVCADVDHEMSCLCMQADRLAEKRKGKLNLGSLAAEVQALRDVKHFVKDYKGHLPLALPASGIASASPLQVLMHSCWLNTITVQINT